MHLIPNRKKKKKNMLPLSWEDRIINNRYKNYVDISIIFDKKMITGYKDSPIDDGPDTFLKLWKERIKL